MKVVNLPEVITIGEILVEIMRKEVDVPLAESSEFIGPFPSGAPAIFIDAAARLGASAGIIGSVGRDEFGECILERLSRDGVDTSYIKEVDELSTGVAFVAYSSDGSRKFIYHMDNSAAGAISSGEVPEEYVKDACLIHISGSSLAMGEEMRKACYEVVKAAEEAEVPISFDPNVRKELLGVKKMRKIFDPVLKSSNLLTPSVNELREICGIWNEAKAAKKMIERGIDILGVKDGEKGCRIYTKDGKVEARAFDVGEVDQTGAGDAFSAAMVVGWLEEMNLKELSVFANAVGGKAVTANGPMEGLAQRSKINKMIR